MPDSKTFPSLLSVRAVPDTALDGVAVLIEVDEKKPKSCIEFFAHRHELIELVGVLMNAIQTLQERDPDGVRMRQ